ncbi:MAG: DUF996 domain-containing protein [Candidatus Thermoplasmatota archaeon]|nr:DUF996 domain-containing protein [Candidatus Thermoplasmatota archaeon]MBU1940463.1 DUF996 domain-containing protein [Candidatus Thermoplasmatota archaeon]
MGSFQTAKILGGIGALLTLIGVFVPSSFGILSFVGFIMVFIAVKMIADATKEKSIFDNYLYAFVAGIIAIVAFLAIILITLASVGGISFFMDIQNFAYSDPMAIFSYLQPVLFGALAGLLVFWIIAVVASLFIRKSYNMIAEKTQVKWFATAGLLFFIGTITAIILIGFLILIIGVILEIVAFFSLPEQLSVKEG